MSYHSWQNSLVARGRYTLEIAKEAMRLAAHKLPIATKFIVRRDYVE